MVERLPKNCSVLLDNLVKSIGSTACLGVKIDCTKSGKNRCQLKVKLDAEKKNLQLDESLYLVVGYYPISVSEIGTMFNAIYPDFLLKPTRFMPLSRLVNDFKFDKEMLAVNIMKKIRSAIKEALKNYRAEDGVSVALSKDEYNVWSSSERLQVTSKFKSFSEFLVWADLNVK